MADERTSVPQSRAVPHKQTRISLVWVIPIVALAVGVWVGISRLRSEGPEITITFHSAEGLEAGKTKINFKGVDVVTLYLLPSVNLELKPILQKGLKPGARVVSHDFDMGDDWKADKREEVDADNRTHIVYLWTIKADQ